MKSLQEFYFDQLSSGDGEIIAPGILLRVVFFGTKSGPTIFSNIWDEFSIPQRWVLQEFYFEYFSFSLQVIFFSTSSKILGQLFWNYAWSFWKLNVVVATYYELIS